MSGFYSHLVCAVISDQGRKRKNNEDAYGVYPESGAFCVADGMGGAEDGEVASHATVEAIAKTLGRYAHADKPLSAQAMQACLTRAVNEASAWIFNRSEELGCRGTGTTFVGVCFDPEKPGKALAIHAGDSRLYRIHKRTITQITCDHSAATLAGVKDESELNPMFRGIVMRAVGVKAAVDLESTPFDVEEGDYVLLCSDGLTRMVADKAIRDIVCQSSGVQSAAQALIDAANANGGIDNVTVVLVCVGALPAPVSALSPEEVEVKADSEEADTQTGRPTEGEPKTDSSQGLQPAALTPDTPSATPHNQGGLFSSDTEEVIMSSPSNPAPADRTVDAKPRDSDRPVTADTQDQPMKPGKKSLLPVVGVIAIFVVGGFVLYTQMGGNRSKSAQASAQVGRSTDDESSVQGVKAVPEPVSKAKKEAEAASQQIAEKKAQEARDKAEAERQQVTAAKKAVDEKAAAEAALLAKKTADEKAAAEVAQLAKQQEEAKARQIAEQKKEREKAAEMERQRLDAEKAAKEKAEAARLAKEQEAAKEKARLLAEQKEKERKDEMERQRAAAAKKAADEAAVAEAAKHASSGKLIELAKDEEALVKYVFVVSPLNKDNENIKRDAGNVLMTAQALAKFADKQSDPAAKEAQKAFVGALANVAAAFGDAVREWDSQINVFELSPAATAEEARKAHDIVAQWDKIIVEIKQLGDLSKDDARLRLVELVRWAGAGMRGLQKVPGLIKTETN